MRVLLYCGRTRTAASPQRTIGGQWRGVSSSRPSIDSWTCTMPVQRTVSPGAVPWGSAAHTGCASRSRSCTEPPGIDILTGLQYLSPAAELQNVHCTIQSLRMISRITVASNFKIKALSPPQGTVEDVGCRTMDITPVLLATQNPGAPAPLSPCMGKRLHASAD